MTRRISVPDDHIALLLPAQLADELQSLAMSERTRLLARWRKYNIISGNAAENLARADAAAQAKNLAEVWGDVLLQLLEAREG